MIGRDFRELTRWTIVPPAASLTLAWGEGRCAIEFRGGSLRMAPGDWMWIDAGFAHSGENLPGSDFLTLFIPDDRVCSAHLGQARIGAAAQQAPPELAGMLASLAVLLLDGASTRSTEAPLLDTLLDQVRTSFEARAPTPDAGNPLQRAAALLGDEGCHEMRIADIARAVGLSSPQLSRQFRDCFRLSPKLFRKQARLAIATRALARGDSVLAAAHAAGFADSAHLSRSFREQYGIGPRRWSQQVAAKPPAQLRSSASSV